MNTVCGACQAVNRLPDLRINDGARCGRCGDPLFSGRPINATAATLDKILRDDLPVVLDFWAPWCAPCISFAPVFASVAQKRVGQLRFVKINTEAEAELSARFRIRSIPTLMLYRQGERLDLLSGALPEAQFNEWLDENLQHSDSAG